MKPLNSPDFGSTGSEYKKYRPSYPAALYETIFSNIKPPYNQAMDLGCGTGLSAAVLSDIFPQVTAVEPDPSMLESGTFAANVTLMNQSAETLDFPEPCFQLITCGNAFYWMDGKKLTRQIYSWLLPEGIFAVYRYNFPLTDNTAVNGFLLEEDEKHWSCFCHDRLKDTGYSLRTIEDAGCFSTIGKMQIPNIVSLSVSELVGFFSSTSYVSAFLGTCSSKDDYLEKLSAALKAEGTSFRTDFSLELIIAKK